MHYWQFFYLSLRAPLNVISKFRETTFQTWHKTKTWSKIPANLAECDKKSGKIVRLLYRKNVVVPSPMFPLLLNLFYSRGLEKVVLHVMVPQPYRFFPCFLTQVW